MAIITETKEPQPTITESGKTGLAKLLKESDAILERLIQSAQEMRRQVNELASTL